VALLEKTTAAQKCVTVQFQKYRPTYGTFCVTDVFIDHKPTKTQNFSLHDTTKQKYILCKPNTNKYNKVFTHKLPQSLNES
jgi:hypothetical protein